MWIILVTPLAEEKPLSGFVCRLGMPNIFLNKKVICLH